METPEGIELAALCLDCGYKFAGHPADLTRDQILFLTAALAYRMNQRQTARLAAEGMHRIIVTEDEEETEVHVSAFIPGNGEQEGELLPIESEEEWEMIEEVWNTFCAEQEEEVE